MVNKTTMTTIALMLTLVLTLTSVSAITETIYLDDYTITYSYSGAEEDDTFSLNLEINNTGSQKEDVLFEFDEDDPFNLDSSNEWNIGTLDENEAVSKSFRIDVESGTDEGKYDLEFNLQDSKDDYNDDLEISVDSNLADLIIGDIKSSPEIITADMTDIKLEITLENIGGGDATFLKAKLELPEGLEKSSSYSDSVNLGTVNAGDSKTATFFINTNEDITGEYTANLVLEYKSDSDKKTDRISFQVPIKEKPSFKLSSSEVSPQKLTAGDKGTLKISVLNSGDKTGEETSIRIFENTDIPIEFSEKTKYIGDLKSGEYGSAIFSFETDSSSLANTYLVKVQVRTISSDSVLTEEFNIPVTISEKESNPKSIITISIISLIAILILLITWFLIIR